MIQALREELRNHVDPAKAAFFPSFFKSGPGQYGEGDQFLGITVPNQRKIARQFQQLPLGDLKTLLESPWHEERLTALFILVLQFKSAKDANREAQKWQQELYEFYLAHTSRINNWDLVDSSARDIVGGYLYQHPELLPVLERLAASSSLWERRIAIIATYYFLMKGEPDQTIKIAKQLMQDNHDLIHKAVGWMLREMGKRCDHQLLADFLEDHAAHMPRTMLRYSIEHFDGTTRRKYLEMKKSA